MQKLPMAPMRAAKSLHTPGCCPKTVAAGHSRANSVARYLAHMCMESFSAYLREHVTGEQIAREIVIAVHRAREGFKRPSCKRRCKVVAAACTIILEPYIARASGRYTTPRVRRVYSTFRCEPA